METRIIIEVQSQEGVTLIRRARETVPVDNHAEIARLTAERDAARAEVKRWKWIADAHEQGYKAMWRLIDEVAAERDALQSRIDGGVRMFHGKYIDSNQPVPQEMLTGILLEPQPLADTQGTTTNVTVNDLQKRQFEGMLIKSDATTPAFDGTPTDIIHGTTLDQSDHIVEPNKMADERKVEARRCNCDGVSGCYFSHGKCFFDANDKRQYNQRCKSGTRADRGKAS